MALINEIAEAKAELARASYALHERRDGLDRLRSKEQIVLAGASLRDLEEAAVTARAKVERVEREVLGKAKAILAERDPDYLKSIADARLEASVEQSVLIGAADRLSP